MNDRHLRSALLALLMLLLTPSLWAANLTALDVTALPGDRIELKLTLDAPMLKPPKGYSIDQPARIALDLVGVSNKLGTNLKDIGVGNARNLTLVESEGRTRLIINLNRLTPYTTRVAGNALFILLGERQSATPSASQTFSPVANSAYSPTASSAHTSGRQIKNVDFRRAEDGAGNLIITLSDDDMTPRVEEQGGKIQIGRAHV